MLSILFKTYKQTLQMLQGRKKERVVMLVELQSKLMLYMLVTELNDAVVRSAIAERTTASLSSEMSTELMS